jgi:hypothetical protein
MKALPPPEDDIDPDGGNVTLVDDSDDEDDSPAPAPAPVSKPVPKPVVVEEPAVIKVVEEPAVVVVEESLVEEVKPKKKIIRKKTDA